MTSTEEKLAQELGWKIHSKEADGYILEHLANSETITSFGNDSLAGKLWRKCLELTEQCPCGCGQVRYESAPTPHAHTADYCVCKHCQKVELTEQRERGGTLSPETVEAEIQEFIREWRTVSDHNTPFLAHRLSELASRAASSRLAEVSAQLEGSTDVPERIPRLKLDTKILQALVEDYQKAVDDSGQHHLIAPENVKTRFDELRATVAGLKGERDVQADPVLAEREPESNWYKLRESRQKALLWQKRAETAEAALSQAQQALRRIRAELSDPEQSPSETFAKIEAILCGCWSPEPPHDLAKVADKAAGWLCILAEFFQAKSDPARNPHMDWLKLAGKTKEVENELRAAERVNHPDVRVVDVLEVSEPPSDAPEAAK